MSEPETIWRWDDLGFFLGAILPCMLVASAARHSTITYQLLFEALLISVLYSLARVRHQTTFSAAMHWTLAFKGAWWLVLAGPLLQFAISVFGALVKVPLIPDAIDQLAALGTPLPVVAVAAGFIGPAFEELVFRGFLQPLLQRSLGNLGGWILASLAFALLHGAQTEWLWQYVVLLFLVGLTLGWARHKTGSTAASFLLHMSYNLTAYALRS